MRVSAARSIQHSDSCVARRRARTRRSSRKALTAAEDYLSAAVAAGGGSPAGDVLELIASTYGAPEDVAAVYRTEVLAVRPLACPGPVLIRDERGAFAVRAGLLAGRVPAALSPTPGIGQVGRRA